MGEKRKMNFSGSMKLDTSHHTFPSITHFISFCALVTFFTCICLKVNWQVAKNCLYIQHRYKHYKREREREKLTELCEKNREQVNYILGERVHPTIFSQLQTYTQVSQREKPFLSMYTTPNTTQN